MPTTNTEHPVTSDRSRGWLCYLYRKATTPDNWDKDGHPHPHWDGATGEPMASWERAKGPAESCCLLSSASSRMIAG
jgi:hypothetical protein